jgi:acetylornithine deacetylase/succinyl-diaminopimelate desuccinylase-like protein
MLEQVLKTIDGRQDASLAGLKKFLSIPSVSTKPDHKPDMVRCAQWLADHLKSGGLNVTVLPTAGHPVVLTKNEHRPGRPTVLVYGHYDVQPPEPLNEWITGPFEPTVRNGAVYARGAADDKGQVWCHTEAALAWQTHGGLPINLTLLIEGEEEIGSDHLEAFLSEHKDALRSDIAVISDTNLFARGVPAITYGLRGLLYVELIVRGVSHDVHSGLFGGTVPNAGTVLTRLLASLTDDDGRIKVAGFYNDVLPLSQEERKAWAELPFDRESMLRQLGITELVGDPDYTPLERRWARPTCDVNGLNCGYQGPGTKTIIPGTASAKLSFRLVPNQRARDVADQVEKHLRAHCPASVQLEVIRHTTSDPVLVPTHTPAMQLAAEAVRIGFGAAPVFMREGGTIHVVEMFKRLMDLDCMLIGFGLPDDRVHSPNEKFDLQNLHSGTRTAAALYGMLSKM